MLFKVINLSAIKKPKLIIIVDTEEDFDWSEGLSRLNRSTKSVKNQMLAHKIYQEFDVKPTYVLDYCVATNRDSVSIIKDLRDNQSCEIGAHLHSWVTPPYKEEVNNLNSYQGNLPEWLERAKIKNLTLALENSFGFRPHVFKAGRYGVGLNTLRLLQEEGYLIDCSYVPYTSFAYDGGPSFLNTPDQPFWIDKKQRFLEIPLTKGFIGPFSKVGPLLEGLFDHPLAKRFHLPGILCRLGISRSVLTPEGVGTAELIKLMKSLFGNGKKVFILTYHSPSLMPGNTPYVKNEADLHRFLHSIRTILEYFKFEIGGEFCTASKLYKSLLRAEIGMIMEEIVG